MRWVLAVVLAGCVSSQQPVLPDAPASDAAPDGAPAGPLDWRGRSIYFVVTDRFANGDASNDDADGFASNLTDPRGWHGGDFQGLIDRLDYIASPRGRDSDEHALTERCTVGA